MESLVTSSLSKYWKSEVCVVNINCVNMSFLDVDVSSPDEKSVITYVSSVYDAFPKVPEGGEGISAHVSKGLVFLNPVHIKNKCQEKGLIALVVKIRKEHCYVENYEAGSQQSKILKYYLERGICQLQVVGLPASLQYCV